MDFSREQVIKATNFLMRDVVEPPEFGILTGTGLGEMTHMMEVVSTVEYRNIPYFPVSTVESHAGRLVLGKTAGKSVIVFQGRFHLYEGYSPAAVTFPIRVMQELGVKTVILTNVAGGLNQDFAKGDIMIIIDHINLTGSNPLVGPNEDTWGIRFPDMSTAYDPALVEFAQQTGGKAALRNQKGVYVGLKGPSLETPAEVRFLKTIGGDAVGFSTIQEVIAAVHAGIRVLGLSVITNVHDPLNPIPAAVAEVIAEARRAAPGLESMITEIIKHSTGYTSDSKRLRKPYEF